MTERSPMRTPVLPRLSAGRARITEATIDNAFGVVRRLTTDDIEWLRANHPEILRQKVSRLGVGLIALVKQIGDAR